MDRQHRPGGKAGSSGPASSQDANIELRERLRKLALETIDLKKDPYFLRNHLGTYECRLCLTLHTNEGSYLAHTQGKKHQTNLTRRQTRDIDPNQATTKGVTKNPLSQVHKKIVRIGRPGYKIVKSRNHETMQKQIVFEIDYSEIDADKTPVHRLMSAYEQKVELPERHYQYLIVAGDPYENIAFKIPNMEIDRENNRFKTIWEPSQKKFIISLQFKEKYERERLQQRNERIQEFREHRYGKRDENGKEIIEDNQDQRYGDEDRQYNMFNKDDAYDKYNRYESRKR